MHLYLTGREIKDLAEYSGFTVEPLDTMADEILEQEFCISKCPSTGVQNDDGAVHHYNHIVTCDGCDGNECIPLGEPIGDCNSGHHPFDHDRRA